MNVISELEETAKKDYKVKNNAAVEDRWLHKMSGEEKAATDPRRYLKEVFPAGEKCPGVVVMKKCNPGWMLASARELGLQAERVEPPQEKGSWIVSGHDHWVVVGQQKSEVTEKVRSIFTETQRVKDEAQRKQDPIKRAKEALARQKQHDLERALAKCEDWDVTGTYNISCPYVEKTWGKLQQSMEYMNEGSSQLTLSIFLEKTPKGPQMFAKFNFLTTAGVMRFERQPDDDKINKSENGETKKKKREYDSGSEDEYGNRKRSPMKDKSISRDDIQIAGSLA